MNGFVTRSGRRDGVTRSLDATNDLMDERIEGSSLRAYNLNSKRVDRKQPLPRGRMQNGSGKPGCDFAAKGAGEDDSEGTQNDIHFVEYLPSLRVIEENPCSPCFRH
ncbi:hypothetical protein YTPLAS18_06300 [Nitrospira sp.]|nr:hypothetical protein YTPLAS18_06300 [Nitrospira sp.]